MTQDEKRNLPDQARDVVIDMRNELIVQSANLYLAVRKALLASLGAVAITAEEANELLDRLVERGELAESDVQNIVRDFRAQNRQREAEVDKAREEITRKASVALEDSVETILTRLNVPNKADIEELSRKIGQLNEKVASLNRAKQQS